MDYWKLFKGFSLALVATLAFNEVIRMRSKVQTLNLDNEVLESYQESPVWKDPLWSSPTTTISSKKNKLVFVHVFKTAGSSFRRFLDAYGEQQGRSVAIVTECSELSSRPFQSNHTAVAWSDREGHPCQTKSLRDRHGSLVEKAPPMSVQVLDNDVDILIGHLPIGVHEQAEYIAFFREPLAKYVSGRLFTHRKAHWTMNDALSYIRRTVEQEVAHGRYYNGYRRYLTTPQQKDGAAYDYEHNKKLATKRNNHDEAAVVDLIKTNLVESTAIIGIVERMGESLALMQSVLDVHQEMTPAFAALDMAAPAATKEQDPPAKMVRNQSELSTSAIVKELVRDQAFYATWKEYLKYEFQIYEFALARHEQQVKAMRQRYGDKFQFA